MRKVQILSWLLQNVKLRRTVQGDQQRFDRRQELHLRVFMGRPTRLLPHAKMWLVPISFFLCWVDYVDYALEGSTFSLSKCDFSRLYHTEPVNGSCVSMFRLGSRVFASGDVWDKTIGFCVWDRTNIRDALENHEENKNKDLSSTICELVSLECTPQVRYICRKVMTHIDLLWFLFLVGRICPLMQEHYFSSTSFEA